MSMNPISGMNPDAYAQKFAADNGISFYEAKEQLREKFGDPAKRNSVFVPEPDKTLKGADIESSYRIGEISFTYNPADVKNATPEQLSAFVRYGMKTTGMSEKEFAQMIGLPDKERPDDSAMRQRLRDLGIPDSIIQEGDKSIRKYAKKNGIELPPKERK